MTNLKRNSILIDYKSNQQNSTQKNQFDYFILYVNVEEFMKTIQKRAIRNRFRRLTWYMIVVAFFAYIVVYGKKTFLYESLRSIWAQSNVLRFFFGKGNLFCSIASNWFLELNSQNCHVLIAFCAKKQEKPICIQLQYNIGFLNIQCQYINFEKLIGKIADSVHKWDFTCSV